MRCPCLEHGNCPIEHLEARVAALEALVAVPSSVANIELLNRIIVLENLWDLEFRAPKEAGGPEPAAPETGANPLALHATPQGNQQATQQTGDSRTAPEQQPREGVR